MKILIWILIGMNIAFPHAILANEQEESDDFYEAISRHESNLDGLLEDCVVLSTFQEQRLALNNIDSRTVVNTGRAELCISTPNLNITAMEGLVNILVGYGTGSIPYVGPVVDEIITIFVAEGFDSRRTKCYSVVEGQRIYSELTAELAKLEEPYQELRSIVTANWWSIARAEDELEELAAAGPLEKVPERAAHIHQLAARKHSSCPMF